ncbi:TPA: hypothetical protein ACGXQD_005674 [Bacillus cereus]|nr:hypothetical protein [Bacillus cereus]MDA1769635.1 hypothetical protein [Bacillus cereus]
MARAGKGDLADYGKSGQVKKKGVKLTVPAFEELADNETINKRQKIQELEGINEQQNKTDHVHEQFLEQFLDNVTKEDTHTRQTWLIKNNTIKRLEKLSKGKKKGFKTELVNQALEMFLNRIEK